ncbi:kallikrein-4-like [Planococcus citri]|uniref:kallikrein-4-like n=1 Tax=Planococcus citri TaxID=170843 RepID=UPI0031F7B076
MANSMILLSCTILSLWIAEARSPYAANSSSKKRQVVEEKQNSDDYQIRKAETKCEEYVQYGCLYQKSFDEKYNDKDQILNGENVPEGMLPHMALLIIKNKTSTIWTRCSGSLISERYVMSVRHCLESLDLEIKIKLGSIYRTNDGTGKWYDVESIHRYPELITKHFVNDIALLKLSEEVHFNPHVIPICLNTKYKGDYERTIASGWGFTEDGRAPERLKMAELALKGEALELKCHQYIKGTKKYADIYKIQTICAGGIDTQKDTCKGDSGGPLQVPLESGCPNTYEQIGITSFGGGNCTIGPTQPYIGIYAKVEYFLPWIASIVWPDDESNYVHREDAPTNSTEQLCVISNDTQS